MTTVGTTLLAAVLMAAPQASPLKPSAPDTTLVTRARSHPLAVREAIADALVRAVRDRTDDALTAAGDLAAAYALAWNDSFLVREVARFRAWPYERRSAKVRADSLRLAGVTVYGESGPQAAVAIWRQALETTSAIHDTAGSAAIAGNIGAAFSIEGPRDSADRYLRYAQLLARAVGHTRVEANAEVALGDLAMDVGDLTSASQHYRHALSLHERIGDGRGVAADQNSLGLLAQSLGDLPEAGRRFEAALAQNRREGRDDVAAVNLVNLAGLASLDGDVARAERLYRDALATWRAHERWADAADALYGLGLLQLRQGNYPGAQALLDEAIEIYDRTGPVGRALTAHRARAAALGARGDLQGALDALRRASDAAEVGGASRADQVSLLRARADMAFRLNDLAEAGRLYSEAERSARENRDPAGEAEAQEGRALVLLENGSVDDAHALLLMAVATRTATGDRRASALTRLSLGRVARERGDTAAAREALASAADALRRVGDAVGLAAVLAEQAELDMSAGFVVRAEARYREALATIDGRPAPDVAWLLHAGLAAARRRQHDDDEAIRQLRAALDIIEQPARSLALSERRSAFLADKWDVYVQLARVERERGRIMAAFETSERLRAREMAELLARGRVAAPADTAAELLVREQDLRRRIAELTRALERVSPGPELLRGPNVSTGGAVTREALLHAQDAYAKLMLEIRERAPRHAELVAPTPAGWRGVAGRLAADQALVEYLVSDSGSLVFVVTRDSLRGLDLGVGRRELARLIEFVRGTLTPDQAGDGALWRGPLRRLHQYLIAPLEASGALNGKTRLVLVPHAELHYLPFAALIDDRERYLAARYELSVTPSASVWLALGDRPNRPAWGILAFAPRPDRLPASRREVSAIRSFGGADVLAMSGTTATEDAFRREAPGRRVLHLATYGVLNKPNPLFSFVDLAPGGGHDGRLEVHEVLGLDLRAELVVLSACQTGLSSGALADVPAGDDWIGLTRAFLHAGAAHVVATLWPVEDQPTAVLMERLYEALGAGDTPAHALAMAQRALLAGGPASHPFYWAGFVTVEGSPRRGTRRPGESGR